MEKTSASVDDSKLTKHVTNAASCNLSFLSSLQKCIQHTYTVQTHILAGFFIPSRKNQIDKWNPVVGFVQLSRDYWILSALYYVYLDLNIEKTEFAMSPYFDLFLQSCLKAKILRESKKYPNKYQLPHYMEITAKPTILNHKLCCTPGVVLVVCGSSLTASSTKLQWKVTIVIALHVKSKGFSSLLCIMFMSHSCFLLIRVVI